MLVCRCNGLVFFGEIHALISSSWLAPSAEYIRHQMQAVPNAYAAHLDERTYETLLDVQQDAIHHLFARLIDQAMEQHYAHKHGHRLQYRSTKGFEGITARRPASENFLPNGE